MQRRRLRIRHMYLIRLKRLLDLRRRESLHLLRCPSNKCARVKERVQLAQDRREECAGPHSLQQIIALPLHLYIVRCLVRQDPCACQLESRLSGADLRISSCASCRESPFFTHAMMIYLVSLEDMHQYDDLTFSLQMLAYSTNWMQTYVAIKGSSSFTRRRITSGYTTNPEVTLSTDVSCEHHGGGILTQKDETSISREVELRKADATNSAVILRPVNTVRPTQARNSPKNAQTIAPSTCREHPWEGSEDVSPKNTGAQIASGYAYRPTTVR